MSESGPSAVESDGAEPAAGQAVGPVTDAEPHPDQQFRSDPDPEGEPGPEGEPQPSWWHRSHPTFASLVGFFVGVAYVIVVPGLYAGLLSLLLSDDTARRLFPLGALFLVVPIVLLFPRRTRRFAQFMLLGVVSTAVVIAVTATAVVWVMAQLDG